MRSIRFARDDKHLAPNNFGVSPVDFTRRYRIVSKTRAEIAPYASPWRWRTDFEADFGKSPGRAADCPVPGSPCPARCAAAAARRVSGARRNDRDAAEEQMKRRRPQRERLCASVPDARH